MAVIKSEYLLPNYDPEEVGMKGEKGDDGKTSYVHIAYSNSSDGGVDFSTTDPTNRAYTGYYTDFEMIDSTDPSKYTWQRTKGEDGADGQLFTGETEPTDFNEGDIWYKVVSGKVTGVYEAKGATWVEIPFESSVIAETIIGKTIQASHLTGSTIDGGKISGAEFLNAYENVTSGENQVTDGKLDIKDGILRAESTYYLTNSAGERLYKFSATDADIHQGTVNLRQRLYDEIGQQTSESAASVSGGLISLSLTDASGNYNGVLDAKALTNTPWVSLTLGSAFETKESNPCQYQIKYNLDGTKTISFRGQFGFKSGLMPAGEFYPFQTGSGTGRPNNTDSVTTIPANILPDKTVFSYAATNTAYGGRLAVTNAGNMVFTSANKASYCSISGMSYTLN